jgi:hypothetical protein
MLVPGVHSDVGGGYRTGEWREVKGDLGCFSAPKQLTKEGKARRLTYCCGRTGRLITTSIPVCPAFLK